MKSYLVILAVLVACFAYHPVLALIAFFIIVLGKTMYLFMQREHPDFNTEENKDLWKK